MLIVCEGQNTERSYFEQFRLSSARIEQYGGKKSPTHVVEFTKKVATKKEYDEVWCVFDKDDFTNDDFLKAIQEAENQKFSVAWSNQSFEYWLILHFEDNHGAKMPRTDYEARINSHINPLRAHYDGKGSKLITSAFFDVLSGFDLLKNESRVQLAIDRAGRRDGECRRAGINPAESESCTTVYKLVKRFLKYSQIVP
ncbi:RloB family protein [Spirosoma aerolatum]|uniref:RloB family protein n=1 Tax=Spirosoma aerolatum TaxID=1211326 RepID=UPI0014748450|nr:RloB family protein [Spirosoma aerolatum]